MDSDGELYDADDSELMEEDGCRDTGMSSDDEDDEYSGNEFDDSAGVNKRQQNYTILSEAGIRQLQEEDINSTSLVLSISSVESCILLQHYKWNVNEAHDGWFAEEENVRKAVGLYSRPVQMSIPSKLTCKICFETYSRHKMSAAACGHYFCGMCWAGYIGTSIKDGPGCLMLRCPDTSCAAAIGRDMVNALTTGENKKKYSRYLLRSYIEDSRKIKWCPAPGCEFAVYFNFGGASFDVSCGCSYGFCWNCREEAHRPVDCGIVAKWLLKNTLESENVNWIIANSKPCPKCKRPIEKNQGCMHMTCRQPCRHEFCWLCLDPWAKHGESTGGYFACNRYEAAKRAGTLGEAERRRQIAKDSLERYTHYYERWEANHASCQKALANLQSFKEVNLQKLALKQVEPEALLEFIIKAWLQVVECRRVLKWTYAYGYYLPEQESSKRHFFEYLQGDAETCLETLHKCVEKELQTYIDTNSPMKEFQNFRSKLVNLTSVTRNYFEKLVEALELGLTVVQHSKTPRSKNLVITQALNTVSTIDDYWWCDRCTFANPSSAFVCGACHGQ